MTSLKNLKKKLYNFTKAIIRNSFMYGYNKLVRIKLTYKLCFKYKAPSNVNCNNLIVFNYYYNCVVKLKQNHGYKS